LTTTKTNAERYLEFVLEEVKDTLVSGEDVLLSGFRKFCVNSQNARKGRNPSTGEDLILAARRVVTFRVSRILKGRLNGGEEK
jgi:integration host factor subunit alpha